MLPHITINEKWGRLLGYLLGDGHISKHGFSIACDRRYDDVVQDVKNLISSIGLHYVEKIKKIDKRCKRSVVKDGYGVDICVTSKTFSLIAEKYNLISKQGKTFRVSNLILQSPKSVIKEFLRGLFESDGSVGYKKNVTFTTKDEILAKQVQYLLLGFGITSHFSYVYNKKYNRYYYTISLRKKESQLFLQEIAFISKAKNEKLISYCSRKDSNHTNQISFNDEIISIIEGVNDVYDVEVEDVHMYNANGIINHNSQLKVIECGFFHKAIIAQNFGPYQLDLIPMIEKGGNVNENGNALLVDTAKNHKMWAKYITKLVKDRDMVKKLQDNLQNTVIEKYSIKTVCEQRVKEYLKMMNKE